MEQSLITNLLANKNVLKFPESSTPVSDDIFLKSFELDKVSGFESKMDLSIYKDLEKRYAENPIRGGITFKTPIKLVNHHSTCKQCHYSLELDTYGRGCIHNCSYCYAKEQLTRHGYWNNPIPVPIDITELRKIFYTIFETNKPSKWRGLFEQKIPLRIGSMSDSFMWMDKKYGVTLEVLRILKHYQYPYIIFTRSDLVSEDEYMNAMSTDLASIQMSISSINDTLNKKIEPGAPSAKKRLKSLQKLSESGFWTAVRINPLFFIHPDGYYSDPDFNKKEAPMLDYFSWDIVDAIHDHKIPSLLAGVVRLSPVAMKQFSNSIGIDYSQFFKKEALSFKGDKRFSDEEVAFYYKTLHRLCEKKGMRFSTCYIGNGEKDYYQYQDLWSNKSDCCDTKGNVKGFKNTCQIIPDEVRTSFAPVTSKQKLQ